jgi:hypothetical protein
LSQHDMRVPEMSIYSCRTYQTIASSTNKW